MLTHLRHCPLLVVAAVAFSASTAIHAVTIPDSAILCCEQASNRILLLDSAMPWNEERSVLWRWDPATCAGLPDDHRGWFTHLSDAKPVLDRTHAIVCASGGGIALVRLADEAVVFHAKPDGNTHSVEILPDGNLVSASSTGNFLKVFSTTPGATAVASLTLADAHGVAWDRARNRLWAVGGTELVRCIYNGDRTAPALAIETRHPLPGAGHGHDLFPVPGTRSLFVTGERVWTFDTDAGTFAELVPLGRVKSISRDRPDGTTIVMQAVEQWWSDAVTILADGRKLTRPGARFYKARWWAPNAFSYGSAATP